jgi:hypothetical protein
VIQHPLSQNSATTAHDAGNMALNFREMLDQQASMNGLIINTLLTMLLDNVKKIIFI